LRLDCLEGQEKGECKEEGGVIHSFS